MPTCSSLWLALERQPDACTSCGGPIIPGAGCPACDQDDDPGDGDGSSDNEDGHGTCAYCGDWTPDGSDLCEDCDLDHPFDD